MEKLKSQVNVTFRFRLMYPPPPEIEIGLNMNAIEQRGHQVHFTIYPHLPEPLSDSIPEQETGEFLFKMDMDIWTQTPSATPLQPKKNEMLIFGLCSTSDDRQGWLMDSNPIHHPSPAKQMKCSFLDSFNF